MSCVNLQEQHRVRCSYRATVAVLVLAVHHVVRGGVLPPDELVKQVVESWDEPKLGQHLVDLRWQRARKQKTLLNNDTPAEIRREKNTTPTRYLVPLSAH